VANTVIIQKAQQNPFVDPKIASGYEAWYQSAGVLADRLEKELLKQMLGEFPSAGTLLETGCGTGHFTRWFQDQALTVVGLDLAFPMLTEATGLNGAAYLCGDAHALPFQDGAFDLVALITTLEFVRDPVRTVNESLRIARQGLILGVLNRHSPLGWRRRREGGVVWGAARFFTPGELTSLVRQAAGRPVQVRWRTTLWPLVRRPLPAPWGDFIGMTVHVGLGGGDHEQ
jgi:ubiquinone/menaquinone biosynthesis C-methylase UbiE